MFVLFLSKKESISVSVDAIGKQLRRRIKDSIDNDEDLEAAIADIEDQLITHGRNIQGFYLRRSNLLEKIHKILKR